jgi:hydroxymethylpyrimidine pyrophosphatase-like HAD family hydrolase
MQPGLLVTDLDGTLLDRRGRVSDRNRAAIAAARAAGWHVAIATGRTWAESHRATDCVAEDALFIGAGGASLHWAGSGEVIATETVDARLALELAHAIVDAGHRAHLLLDPSLAGHDYVFLGTAELDPATRWWLSEHPVTARDWARAPEGAVGELEGRVLRVGTIGPSDDIAPVARRVEERYGPTLAVRHWSALTSEEAIGSRTHMLEAFSPRADKWSMACVAANRLGVPRDRIVALGDGLNDLELLRNAPIGVAMENADERILGIAAARTASHDADGVAVAVEALLDGRLARGWDGSSRGAPGAGGATA